MNIRCFLGFHVPGPKWEIFYDSYCRCPRCGNILTGHFGGSDPDMYWRRDYADHPPSFFAMEPKPAQDQPQSTKS